MKRTLADFPDLTPAEQRLREEVGLGDFVIFGDEVPAAGAESPVITADFLRYLILGGCDALPHPVPETGVRIVGARITGTLNLEGCRVPRDIALVDCRIDALPILTSAEIDNLFLNGSTVPGLKADRLLAQGGVFLRNAIVYGEVILMGATLGGSLDADGSKLTAAAEGDALSADRMKAKGSVSLRWTTVTGAVNLAVATVGGEFSLTGATLTASKGGYALSAGGIESNGRVVLRNATVNGEVMLLGATLGGGLDADGATLNASKRGFALSADRMESMGDVFLRGTTVNGAIRLPGAKLGGGFDADGATLTASKGGFALDLQGARVSGRLLLRLIAPPTGYVDLSAAHVVDLLDPESGWPETGKLILDGFTYDRFVGMAPQSAGARIDWLERQPEAHLTHDFRPQPWEHCVKVLREAGRDGEAHKILNRKEYLQRRAQRTREWAERRYLASVAHLTSDGVFWLTTDYGRRPLKAVLSLIFVWLLGAAIFHAAAERAAIKPNSPVILRAPEWAACAATYLPPSPRDPPIRWRGHHASQLACFQEQPEARGYPPFNALVYSADTLLPIVDLEMQGFWIPDGVPARVYLWLHIALGWALSLLAVAGFSGLIKTDNT